MHDIKHAFAGLAIIAAVGVAAFFISTPLRWGTNSQYVGLPSEVGMWGGR